MAWSQQKVKELGVNTAEGAGEQAGMKKKEWHKSKQRRIWAVNPPALECHTGRAAGAGDW